MSNANQSANGARAGDQLDERMERREHAIRYGRLAAKIAKAGGMAFGGLAGMAMGTTIGRPEIGVHMLNHAAAEVIQIIDDLRD